MDISLFDFELSDDCIALRPAVPRDHARQLIIGAPDGADVQDNWVYNLPTWLKPGDALVVNDTRVIPSRLYGTVGDAKTEITLHKRLDLTRWVAFMKNARRARTGKNIIFNNELYAEIEKKNDDGSVTICFQISEGKTMEQALIAAGHMPLPPYIAKKRDIDDQDNDDYQTVYNRRDGAVAAPTAGLHFTPNLLKNIEEMGVRMVYVTLHVGAGTFLPVKVEDTKDHKMHAEWGEVTPETARTLNDVRAGGGRIIAVGTTSLRLLETAAGPDGIIHPFSGDTAIFITPGYVFRAVDMLMTNFHLPKSTLFMLVCAFGGMDRMKRAYAHAIQNGYRFYSYGDSSLIFKATSQETI